MAKHTYLLDSNIALEFMFCQEQEHLAFAVFRNIDFRLTKFSFDSILIGASFQGQEKKIMELMRVIMAPGLNKLLDFDPEEALEIYEKASEWQLDFDDAHLMFIAKREKLRIVTFDKHLLKYPEIAIHPAKLV